jgi:hypothetical protein
MPNNREWALFFWLAVLAVFLVVHPSTRRAIGQFLPAVSPVLLIPVVLLAGLTAAEVWGARRLGIWDPTLTTGTVVWFVTGGLAIYWHVDETWKTGRFFQRRLLAAISLPVVLQGYLTLVTLPLGWELALQPILTMAAVLGVVASRQQGARVVQGCASVVLSVAFVSILAYVTIDLATRWSAIGNVDLLRSMALPLWLPLPAIPFVYCVGLFFAYQAAFRRLAIDAPSARHRRRAKCALVVGCSLRARPLSKFVLPWPRRLAAAPTWAACQQVVKELRAERPR